MFFSEKKSHENVYSAPLQPKLIERALSLGGRLSCLVSKLVPGPGWGVGGRDSDFLELSDLSGGLEHSPEIMAG